MFLVSQASMMGKYYPRRVLGLEGESGEEKVELKSDVMASPEWADEAPGLFFCSPLRPVGGKTTTGYL
jgi:hypothetical protein